MQNKELSGYWPESILSPKPIRFELAIDGHDLVAVPRTEWLEIMARLTPEEWKEVFLASR